MASPNVVDKSRINRSRSAYCVAPSLTIWKEPQRAAYAFFVSETSCPVRRPLLTADWKSRSCGGLLLLRSGDIDMPRFGLAAWRHSMIFVMATRVPAGCDSPHGRGWIKGYDAASSSYH